MPIPAILLDEHLDVRLKLFFDPQLIVFTIKNKKWQGTLNGELLQLLIEDKIGIFITNDKNLRYQQKLNELDLIIIELNTKGNQYVLTAPVIIGINKYLYSLLVTLKLFNSSVAFCFATSP